MTSASKSRADATGPDVEDRISALERSVGDLSAGLARRDARIADLERALVETSSELAGVRHELPRPLFSALPMPRALRVARKRMKAWGLWPTLGAGRKRSKRESSLEKARLLAPPSLAPFLKPLSTFDAWIEANRDTLAASAESLAWLASAPHPAPRISVITPVYNTRPDLLAKTLESVRAQSYGNWELCVADDASTTAETVRLLREFGVLDPRIRIVHLSENGGIGAATNAAAAMATGDVLAFLDHDDLLTPDALMEVAAYYAHNPEADLVYSDDDKIDEAGRRYAPQFKPDWSPVLHLSYMYLSHLLTVRRDLFLELGGFSSAFDGSQDYDFALRAVERARHVGHIPRILYHWRAIEGSTALSGGAKPESFEAGRKAVENAAARRGINARVLHPSWALDAEVGMFALKFPDHGPAVTIIVPTYNRAALLRDCIESLELTVYPDRQVLVIDNGSDEADALAYLAEVAGRPGHRVVRIPQRPAGFSFAALMNEAVEHCDTPYVLFLNNDTRLTSPSWLSQMMGYAQMEGVGAVGARLHFADGTLQHGGIVHGYHEGLVGHAFRGAPPHDWGYMGFLRTAREYSAVTAACLLTSLETFKAIGGFDEDKFAVAYNDVDYCYRLVEHGLTCIYCPDAELFHFEGKTRGYIDDPEEVVAFRQTYSDWNDRWYNTNLSLEVEDFRPRTKRPALRTGRRVRIAAVSHNLRFEGAPNTLFDLLVGLKRTGVADVVVLSPSDGPLKAAYEAEGIEVRRFHAPLAGTPLRVYEGLVGALSSMLQMLGAETVIANTLTTYYAVDAAARAGLGAVWCQHESEAWETYFDDLDPDIRVRAYAAFGQAYAVTYVAEATRRAWAPVQTRANARLIRHGVPPERLAEEVSRWSRSEARRRLDVEDGDVVLVTLGTVCQRKGQLDLPQAIAALSSEHRGRIRVFLAGALAEPDYVQSVVKTIAALPPEIASRVALVGPVPDMMLYYAAADIFVCTSRVESAPRVIVEAMAFGLPIITTPVFGIPELVARDVNALFYEPGRTGDLAGLIARLIDDEALRATLARTSRSVLESRPGYEDMIKGYTALVQECALLASEATPS